MKNPFIFLYLLIPFCCFADLPDFYHDYDETIAVLDSLRQVAPDIMKIDTLGYSQQDSIPIIIVKMSDPVEDDRDVPRLIFVGEGHAEENLGVEIIIYYLRDLVDNRLLFQNRLRLLQTEMYFIPTLNPEGFMVIFGQGAQVTAPDVTYRKNKRDNIGDGFFRYAVGEGGDTSGVDFNRNFDMNWIHGDTLFQAGHTEFNDYYRGPAPFSESENAALKALAEEKHFCLGIVYHQSRSTLFSEKVIYPWNWGESEKLPPDHDVINDIGIELSQKMQQQGSGQPYEPNLAQGRYGNSHDWFYAAMGCFQYTVETSDIQPASQAVMEEIVWDNIDGMIFLIDRARGYSEIEQRAKLTGIVTDSLTGLPLESRVEIIGRTGGLLQPRMTDPVFGRYRRYLLHGTYGIEVSKPGYATKIIDNISVTQTGAKTQNVELVPLPGYEVCGTITDVANGTPLSATVYFIGDWCDTLYAPDGMFAAELPRGEYTMRVDADDYVSLFEQIGVYTNLTLDRELSPGILIFHDDFEIPGLANWETTGEPTWDIEIDSLGGASLADSPGELYGSDIFTSIDTEIDLAGMMTAHLSLIQKYYIEPDYDFGYIEVSTDGQDWETLEVCDGYETDWHEARYDLTPYCGGDFHMRFALATDGTLGDPGWNIDDVMIMASDLLSKVVDQPRTPHRFYLKRLYPNPFNSTAMLRYSLEQSGQAEMKVYNMLGRKVASLLSGNFDSGPGVVRWNAADLPSGIYFVRFISGGETAVVKTLLLK